MFKEVSKVFFKSAKLIFRDLPETMVETCCATCTVTGYPRLNLFKN